MNKQIVAATKAVLLHKNRVLLLKRSDYDSIHAGAWEFPGGRLEFGETLEEGLTREMREEAGKEVSIVRLLFVNTFLTAADCQMVVIKYLCHCSDADVTLSAEHTDYLWAGKEQVPALLMPPVLEEVRQHKVLEQVFHS